jgi:hypothetical protein
MSDLTDRVKDAEELLDRGSELVNTAKAAKSAIEGMLPFLSALESGDKDKAKIILTEWIDVNETLLAIDDVDAELLKSNIQWEDVEKILSLIGKGIKVVVAAGII